MIKTFLFVDPDGYDPVKCSTTISINEEKLMGRDVFNIKITSVYSNDKRVNTYLDLIEHRSHPLMSVKHNKLLSYYKGFVVIKNEMTTKMLDFLMMENDQLAEHTFDISPMAYRRKVLISLINFAD